MTVQPELAPLAPLARVIADTVRDTPVRLGSPEGAGDLVAMLVMRVGAYMGPMVAPEQLLATAKAHLSIPKVVCICGSTRFMAQMVEADLRETAAGRIVVKPGVNMKQPHELWATPAQAEPLKVMLDELHQAKIRMADEVLVVGDYIGDSTTAEIAYARKLGKPVRFTHPEVDPNPEA